MIRRVLLSALAAMLPLAIASVALAQQAGPPAAQAPPPAAPGAPAGAPQTPAGAKAVVPPLVFTGDAAFVIFTVKADGAAEFESFFSKVKEVLEKGAKPEYKDMAAHWTLFKVTEVPQAGQVLYASVINPSVPGADYDPVKILSEASPADAAALYPKLKDALLGVNRMNLQTVK